MFGLFSNKKRRTKASARRLGVESLENRLVLATVSVSDFSSNGNLANDFDARMVIDGTSESDNFEFIAGTDEHRVIINGEEHLVSASLKTQIVFYGSGGDNTADLTGGPGSDRAELRETSAKLTGDSYQVLVYTTRDTTVRSGGGQDRAYFYDTVADDSFAADPAVASLAGTNYSHSAHDFPRVYAFTTDGNDVAHLTGSAEDDRYKATPTDARMYGSGYYNYTRGFDEVHGNAAAGTNDRAYFYDSAGRDTFDSTANESRMFGTGFDNYAHGFDRVYAFASDNIDTAIFRDSGGSDYYKVDAAGARLYGDDYYNRAIGFDVHYVYFDLNDGETDRVAFHDSSGNDFLIASGDRFTAVRSNAVHAVYHPDAVFAEATTGRDRAIVRSANYQLELEGDWDPWRRTAFSGTV